MFFVQVLFRERNNVSFSNQSKMNKSHKRSTNWEGKSLWQSILPSKIAKQNLYCFYDCDILYWFQKFQPTWKKNKTNQTLPGLHGGKRQKSIKLLEIAENRKQIHELKKTPNIHLTQHNV